VVSALFIISQKNFNDTEFSVTKRILEQAGVKVTVSSISRDEATGMSGLKITPEKKISEVSVDEYDVLVIIGGSGSPTLLDYPEVLDKVRAFDERGKIIAAICLGPAILARAGVLKGINSTVFPSEWAIALFMRNGAKYTPEHVVVDKNIITADGPDSVEEFANRILKKLSMQ